MLVRLAANPLKMYVTANAFGPMKSSSELPRRHRHHILKKM
jgi:hypothetical protein